MMAAARPFADCPPHAGWYRWLSTSRHFGRDLRLRPRTIAGMKKNSVRAAHSEGGYLPEVDPVDCQAACDYLFSITLLGDNAGEVDEREKPPGHLQALTDVVPLIESLLAGDEGLVPASVLAHLGFMALYPSIPEAIAVQIAFGRKAGERNLIAITRLIARADQCGLSVDDYVAQAVAEGTLHFDSATRLLRGEVRRPPDASRLAKGIALISRGVALMPPQLRPALLCVLGWLHWASGRHRPALTYLTDASVLEPQHILAYGLHMHFLMRPRPAWLA